MLRYYFLVLFIFYPIHMQNVIIDDISEIPLQNVNIFNHLYGTTTDSIGRFYIDDNFGEKDSITFSIVGYETMYLAKKDIPKTLRMVSEYIDFDAVEVFGSKRKVKKKYRRLERDVRKVYPFSKVFSNYLETYEDIMDTLDNFSGLERYYKKRKIFSVIEDEMLQKYDYSLRKLTRRQGRILIRLIDREANRTSFNIIKDFRNGFIAGFWQITARLFGHNLKSSYNPLHGEDRLIESIIRKIEAND